MRNDTRIREINRALALIPDHIAQNGKQFGKNRHAVGYRANFFVPYDLGDEISRGLQILIDGHTDSDIQNMVRKQVHQTVGKPFADAVGRPKKIGLVVFMKSGLLVRIGMGLIVLKDTTGTKIREMNVPLLAQDCK